MRAEDRERIRQLVSFAESHLPLSDIATGPGDDMGFGPEFEGIGTSLIRTALQSPVIRNRNLALKVLEAWRLDSWPSGIVDVLIKQQQTDPDGADVRLLWRRMVHLWLRIRWYGTDRGPGGRYDREQHLGPGSGHLHVRRVGQPALKFTFRPPVAVTLP